MTRDQNLQTMLHMTVSQLKITSVLAVIKIPIMALTSLLQFDLTDADNIGQNVTAKNVAK